MALDISGGFAILNSVPSEMANASKFSLACWLYQKSFTQLRGIHGVGNGFDFIQYQTTDQIIFFFNAGSPFGQCNVGDVPIGSWHHIGWRFDGDAGADNGLRLKLWVDGVQKALIYSGTIPTTIGGANISFRIGGSPIFPTRADVILAHLRGWTAALSEDEFKAEMRSYWAVRRANIQYDIPLDDGTPTHAQQANEPYIPKDYTQHILGNPSDITDPLVQVSGPPGVAMQLAVQS